MHNKGDLDDIVEKRFKLNAQEDDISKSDRSELFFSAGSIVTKEEKLDSQENDRILRLIVSFTFYKTDFEHKHQYLKRKKYNTYFLCTVGFKDETIFYELSFLRHLLPSICNKVEFSQGSLEVLLDCGKIFVTELIQPTNKRLPSMYYYHY